MLMITAGLSRILINTARRFIYPFAPAISRGLEVPLTSVTSLIAVNQATGIFGFIFGPMADRFGYRLMMTVGLSLLVLGMFAAGFFPFYLVVLAAMFLAGLGKNIFDPALQAYVGKKVSFQRRGLAIGLLEFSWAGSTLIGIPAAAFLIEKFDWRAPFFVLGGLGLLCMVALRVIAIGSKKTPSPAAPKKTRMWSAWIHLLKNRAALGAVGFDFFAAMANDNLFVVYGAWLESSFGLSIMALGLGTIIIGTAEFAGELMTATIADRFGLKRMIIIGLILSVLCYFLLPFLGGTLILALTGLFFIFLTFEFAIVTFMSLATELLPGYRATLLSMLFAAAGLGRVAGAMTGGYIWMAGGIYASSMVSAVLTALSLACLVWGLHGWRRE